MSIGTSGRSTAVGDGWSEGGGLDRQSASGRGTVASLMRSESGVVDML